MTHHTQMEGRARGGRPPGFAYTAEERKRISMSRRQFWERDEFTQERRAQLKALIEQGLTNKAAGAVMGISKSSVSGMLDRMIKSGMAVNRPPKPVKAVNKSRVFKAKIRWRERHAKGPQLPRPRQHIDHPPMTPVGLLERTGCCFPVNDGGPFLFCNNSKREQSSYCLFHGNLMVSG